MKTNEDTVIVGEKVVLVPYRPEHVPTYNQWMLDEGLRALTASEPLSLEEEYKMQQTWAMDEDKLTFIVLGRTGDLRSSGETHSSPISPAPQDVNLSPSDPCIALLPMIGDVNIFLKGTIPFQETKGSNDDECFEAEVEIMIAEPDYRRRGLALETLQLMLKYATGASGTLFGAQTSHQSDTIASALNIPPTALVARISESNTPSIRLFEKLGFKVTKRVEVFGEVEMRWFRDNE